MKQINFKIFKFSTIIKKVNLSNYRFTSFHKISKNIKNKLVNLFSLVKSSVTFGFFKKTKFIGRVYESNINFKFRKYFPQSAYNIFSFKKLNFLNNRFFLFHIPGFVVFFGFLYFFIPTFYSYDKKDIENIICKKNNIECLIKGKVSYNFYPTPRIKITDLLVTTLSKEKKPLIKIDQAAITLSIKNLLAKEKHKFKTIKVNSYEINYNHINTENNHIYHWVYKILFTNPFTGLFTAETYIYLPREIYMLTTSNEFIDHWK